MARKVLVTGGAGYIGSHVVRQLGEAGFDVVTYDNLSTGNRDAVLCGKFVEGDLSDLNRLEELFSVEKFDGVLHFAASIQVGESVQNPLKYYNNNTRNTLNLISTCQKFNVAKFIFSSTAATYGMPSGGIAIEDGPQNPINPYGASKLMVERILKDYCASSDFRFVALRYFNVAGADLESRIGLSNEKSTLLVKMCCHAAIGLRDSLSLFGTDYETKDGTCIRDYIHVEDLAQAHLDAYKYLEDGGASDCFNCGYGHGYSVKEVIDVAKKVTGVNFKVIETDRRDGDPPILISNADKIQKIIGWKAKYDDLELIVKSDWAWEQKLKSHQR